MSIKFHSIGQLTGMPGSPQGYRSDSGGFLLVVDCRPHNIVLQPQADGLRLLCTSVDVFEDTVYTVLAPTAEGSAESNFKANPPESFRLSLSEFYEIFEKATRELREGDAPGYGCLEDEESMGDCNCPGQGTPHECGDDVHVGEQPADLQHHDGVHALQESHTEPDANEPGLYEIRDGGDEEDAVAH